MCDKELLPVHWGKEMGKEKGSLKLGIDPKKFLLFFFLWHKPWPVKLVGSKKMDCHPDCLGSFVFWQSSRESFPAGESQGGITLSGKRPGKD